MIRRAFVRALSGAILTTLLGVKAWRLEVEDTDDWAPLPLKIDREPDHDGYQLVRIIGVDRHPTLGSTSFEYMVIGNPPA